MFSISAYDRAYQYDQAGRLHNAMSGVEANDFLNNTQTGPHSPGPFQQSYTHDVWNNMISRTGTYWSEQDTIGTQTYDARNRNSAWTYDAHGRRRLLHTIRPALKIPELPFKLGSFGKGLDAHFQSQRLKLADVSRALQLDVLTVEVITTKLLI
jgi:hypothetical protein